MLVKKLQLIRDSAQFPPIFLAFGTHQRDCVALVATYAGENGRVFPDKVADSIAAKIGRTPQTLHEWVKKAHIDSRRGPRVPMEMVDKLWSLERGNRELRQANEIMRKARAYFLGWRNSTAGTSPSCGGACC
jgi:transposase